MKWEYMTMMVEAGGFMGGKIDGQEFTDRLNKHGAAGWELVSVFDTNMAQGQTRNVVAIFKRPMN